MTYKTQLVEWQEDDVSISVECLYHEDDPGHNDEWLPDMATLEVDGPYPTAGSDAWQHIWSKAYDLANA